MLEHSAKTNRKVRAGLVVVSFVVVAFITFFPEDFMQVALSQARRSRPTRRTAAAPRKVKYSEFPHDAAAHKIECGSCHKFPSENWNKVRTGDAAFPDITDYPKHESCLSCHRPQFYRGNPPVVCSICHTTPGPRASNRHPFPNPRDIFDQSKKGKTAQSDFAIYFPHPTHIDIVTADSSPASRFFRNVSFKAEESCVVCHTTFQPQGDSSEENVTKPPSNLGDGFWLKKGTFKTKPTSHTTCFTCHSQDSGISPAPTDCGTCHKLKQPEPPADFDPKLAAQMGIADRLTLDSWKRRDSSGKYRHEFAAHADLSCDTCHSVQTLVTTDAPTKRVRISSCAMCHVTATLGDGGALNFEAEQRKTNPAFQCTKCHIVFGQRPMPPSHVEALAAAGK